MREIPGRSWGATGCVGKSIPGGGHGSTRLRGKRVWDVLEEQKTGVGRGRIRA